jgi:hypothetical protein
MSESRLAGPAIAGGGRLLDHMRHHLHRRQFQARGIRGVRPSVDSAGQCPGGSHHGYFLPAEGASDQALACFSFPSLLAAVQDT